MQQIFASSIEDFFAGKTDVEIRDFVNAPYCEAREEFEKELDALLGSSVAVAA